jgi:zinc transporter, ZIP family
VSDSAVALAVAAVVAASLVAGSGVAAAVRLPSRVAASLTAFGGGLLFAAVALELVPEADDRAATWVVSVGLIVGTVLYVGADWLLTANEKRAAMRRSAQMAAAGRPMPLTAAEAEAARGESIAVGLFVDGVPESVALGITIGEGELAVPLLVGVVVGNLVEAYGAAQPLAVAGGRSRFAVVLLGGIGLALAAALIVGATVLDGLDPAVVGFLQALAAGAVLAVVTVSIVPHAFSEVSRWVAVASVLGFLLGYVVA